MTRPGNDLPIVVAAMAGGASTRGLLAAATSAGGFGFLAAGYKTPQAMADDIASARARGLQAVGVNLFLPGPSGLAESDFRAYASSVASWMVMFPTARQLPALSELTAREYEIVLKLASGERVRQLARGLHLGESTVRNHLTSVFRKMGVSSQGELLVLLREAAGAQR